MSRLIPRLREWLPYVILVLTLAFYPIIGIGQTLVGIVNTTPIAILYRAFYLLLCVVLLLIYVPSLPGRKLPLVLPSLLAFWVIYLARIFYDIVLDGPAIGYAGKGLFFFLTYGLGGCLAPAVVAALAARTLNYRVLNNLLLAFFLICNVLLFAFILFDNGFSTDIFRNRFRVGDSVVSPITMSQYGGALLIMATSSWLITRRKGLLYPALMLVGFLLLVLGSSRGPLASAVVCAGLLLADQLRIRAKSFVYWSFVMGALLLTAVFIVKFIIPNLDQIALLNRVTQTIDNGSGLDEREQQWSSAWEQFIGSPVFGDSLIENAFNFYPHNFLLEVLMATGIVGALALLPAGVIFIKKYLQRWSYAPEKRVYFYLFIFFFGCSMFSLSLITNAHLWIVLGLVGSLPRGMAVASVEA